jgi:beta-exotoxin I transport system permease protein
VSWPATWITLRQRLTGTLSTAVGLIAVMAAVGALFPAVGQTIGKLNVPESVANLLGGADYGTITGWFRSEIAVIYGPLVIAALAITGATAATAGEEEDRILALVLAHPIRRSRLVLSKAGAIAVIVAIVAFATWIGLIVGVALGGGGISVARAIAWLKYFTLFYYYAGRDPIGHGLDLTGIVALGVITVVLIGLAVVGFDRRDLRA